MIMKENKKSKMIINNRKVRFEYDILETLEAGIVLKGTEVKSIRQGGFSLRDRKSVV